MSVKVIAQLNAFSTEKTEYEFEPQSLNDIIKKIDKSSASNTGWRALFNDEIITDFSRVPVDGTTVLLKLVPTGDNQDIGVGMKIGGGALAALGVIVGIAVGWTGVGLTFASTLIGSGVSMLLGGIALYNMDIPSLKDRPSPEQDASIRGSQNQLRQRGYIPVLFGKRRFYADLAMTSYTWVDPSTGSMYLYQLFCAGQKDITIDESSLKIDETLLSSYISGDNIEYEIAYGEDVPPMFEKCIHEDQVLAILKHSTEDGTDASVIKTTPECTEINVDIFFHNGLAKYNDDGGLADTTVEVKAYYKKADEPDSAYQLLGNFTESGNSITGKELKTKRFAITKSGLDSASYTVKLTRVTADSTNSKVIDDVYVGSIRAIKNELPVSARRCRQLTLLALKIKATEKLNNVVQKLNFVSQAKMPVWDGVHSGPSGWTQSSLTSNPASAAIYAMQSEIAQQRLSSNEIDWQSFERLYTWCNTHEYECNTYVSESMSISQLLTAIGSTCRTEILRMNGKITALMDVERNSSVQLFTPRNSYDYSETIISADIPDALNIGFEDKDSGYAANELYVYNTPSGNKSEEPHTIQDVPLWGVTSSEQARKLGMWKYAVTKNRPFIHSWSCDVEYLMCQKGDRVKYAGDIALIGTTQCRVTECIFQNQACIGIKVDEVIQMQEGVNVVRYRKSNGELKLQTVVFSAEPTKELFFETAPSTVEAPEPDNLVAVGLQDFDTIDLIITDIRCDNNLSAEITAVDYSPEVFGVDSPDFVLPEFKNKISAVPASVDDGIVSANEWKLFFTYHDSASEPAIPEGDGTTNGWHTTPTVESIWVSSKTAEDILSGQWSKPRKTMGQKGDPGEPGRTPSVSVSKTGTVTTINIDGQTSTVNDGEKGSDGTRTFYSDIARTWNNENWELYSTVGNTPSFSNSTIEGMRIGDILVVTATLSEKGNSKGQVFAEIRSIPTTKESNGNYSIPCKIVSSLIGEKGQQGQKGEKALQATRNWSGTYTTITATATASTTDFNRTPVVGDTFQTLDGSSNYGTWQVTAISGTSVTIKLLSYVVAKGNTGSRGSLEFSGTEIKRIVSGEQTESLSTASKGITASNMAIYVGDTYVNSNTQDVWKCTTAGTPTTAKWTYQEKRSSNDDNNNTYRFFTPATHYSSVSAGVTASVVSGENPFGETDSLLKVYSASGTSKASNTRVVPYNKTNKIDSSKTYRYVCYIKQTTTGNTDYFGAFEYESVNSYVTSLSGGNISGAYFTTSTNFGTAGRWYMVVGYIVASNLSTAPSGSGVYDCVTGKKVKDVTNFRWKAGSVNVPHSGTLIGYVGSASTIAIEKYIYDIRLDVMNGKEPSIYKLLHKTERPPKYLGSYTTDANCLSAIGEGNIIEGDYYLFTDGFLWYTSNKTNFNNKITSYSDYRYTEAMNDMINLSSSSSVSDGLKTAVNAWVRNLVAGTALIDNLNVNKLSSPSFDYDIGFAMNGTSSAMTVNGKTVEANTEYHYGNAIYMSDYIKTAKNVYCTSLGYRSGTLGVYQGTYDSSVNYKKTDIVSYAAGHYICKVDCKNVDPGNPSYWTWIGTALNSNTSLGNGSLSNVLGGSYNTAIGFDALKVCSEGTNNTALGAMALISLTTGTGNSAIGLGSMLNLITGSANVGLGAFSAQSLTTGHYNIAIGYNSGRNLTTGSNNVAIGFFTNAPSKYMSHQINIGDKFIYLEFKAGVHTNDDVFKCLFKYMNSSNGDQYLSCLGQIGIQDFQRIQKYSSTQLRFLWNTSSRGSVSKNNNSTIASDIKVLFTRTDISSSNDIRPTDIS